MRVKPTEARLVASLLGADYEDAEAAAEAVITALDAKRADDKKWAAVMHTSFVFGGRRLTVGRGPYGTKKRALDALSRFRSAGPESFYGEVVELRNVED